MDELKYPRVSSRDKLDKSQQPHYLKLDGTPAHTQETLLARDLLDAERALGEIAELVYAGGWTDPDAVARAVRQFVGQAKQGRRQQSQVLHKQEQRIAELEAELARSRRR